MSIQTVNPSRPIHDRHHDFLRLMGIGAACAVLLALVGWIPTARIAGPDSLPAMLVGIGCSLAGTIAASIPAAFAKSHTPMSRQIAMLGSMALRMAVTMVIVVTLVFSTSLPRVPLVFWTAISYLALLAVETYCLVQLVRQRESNKT